MLFAYYYLSLSTLIVCLLNPELQGCKTNPCKFGGTCMVSQDGSEICRCRDGYSGAYCEIGLYSFPPKTYYNIYLNIFTSILYYIFIYLLVFLLLFCLTSIVSVENIFCFLFSVHIVINFSKKKKKKRVYKINFYLLLNSIFIDFNSLNRSLLEVSPI